MDGCSTRSVDDADGGQRQVSSSKGRVRLPPSRPKGALASLAAAFGGGGRPDTTYAILCVVLIAAIGAGCSSPQKTESSPSSAAAPKAPDGRELRAVTLPDLSQLSQSAQQQIRDQYASLMKTIGSRPSVVESSRAYGEMGKLLLAAQYY